MTKRQTNYRQLLLLLVCFFTSSFLLAQQRVSGTVTDGDNLPLIGVNVVETGTSNGTVTDLDGNYELTVNGTSLTFTYTGFQSQTVDVAGKSQVSITMSEGALLDEVVVVGYGTQKKSDLTGAVVSVSSKDFDKQPLTRIDQALQGRSAGVAVTQTSGGPGSGFKIRVRGANSINGSNAPLYVVDGLIVGDIGNINVNDIQSLEVLKDASATAIYGSRGANGVVLITTKRGKAGQTKVELNTFWGTSQVVQELDVMTPAEFAEGVNFAEGQEIFSASEIAELQAGGGENWHDRIFRTAASSNYQLSVSGGSDKVDYYISGNVNNEEGTLINQDYKRYNFRANINAKVSDRLTVGFNTFGNREERTGARANVATALSWDLTTPAFDENGEYNFTPLKPGVGNGTDNPLVRPENIVGEGFNHRFLASTYLNYNLAEGLDVNVSGGFDRVQNNFNSYGPLIVNNQGRASVFNGGSNRFQNTNRITYKNDNNPDHRFQIDAIHEQQLVRNAFTNATAEGFFSDNTTYKNLGLGEIQRVNNGSSSESIQSFLGRVNYTLFEQLLLTASVRADGASKFRRDNRWGVFPSGSIAYRLSETDFIKNNEVVDNLKFRVSYGVTGSQGIGALATRAQPVIDNSINYPFTGDIATIGVAPSSRLANPDLTWEKTAQINGGVDIGFWDSKLTLSLDIYQKNTTDLLLDVFLPEFVGPTVVARNIGEVENKGFDINLGYTPVRTNDWVVSTTLNFSRNKNTVLALVDDQPIEKGNFFGLQQSLAVRPTRVEVGQPISAFRGYIFEGVYQLDEADEAAEFGREPGDAKYADLNGDGTISPDDITTVGDGNPDFTWGLNTNVTYRNFDLNFIILGSQGNDIYNFQRGRMMALGEQQFHATHKDYVNRWTENNPSNIPSGRDGTEFLSSQFVEDGSYVTLKNVSLSYTLNSPFEGIGLEAARFYVNASNLFILTDYTGFDPESTVTGDSDVDLGIDFNAYPLSRTFTFGVNLTF